MGFVVIASIGSALQSLSSWLADHIHRVWIGNWVENLVNWSNRNIEFIFDWIKEALTWLNDGLGHFLGWPIPIIMALILAFVAWRIRGPLMALFTFIGLMLIKNFGLWDHAMLTMSLVLISAAVALAIGIPCGILTARSKVFSALVRPVLDFMQTMPAFVYLIPAVSFFHIGAVPGMVATVVFSMPPAVRLTELGIRQVDEEVVEAGHAFGASPRRILFGIQLPLARPTIMAGVNQVIMLSLSMVVIAGMIGAEGLGADVYYAVQRISIGPGFEAGLAVVILAVILDRFTGAFGTESETPKHSLFKRLASLLSRGAEQPGEQTTVPNDTVTAAEPVVAGK